MLPAQIIWKLPKNYMITAQITLLPAQTIRKTAKVMPLSAKL